MSDRLYATVPPERFFRIPADVDLPAGDLRLKSLTGDVIRVSAEAAGAYELDEEQARVWVQQRMGLIAGGVGSFLSRARTVLEEVGAIQHAAQDAGDTVDPAATGGAPAVDLPSPAPADGSPEATQQRVAGALGLEPDQLSDVDLFVAGFKKMAEGIKDSMEAMARANPATPEQIESRMAAVGEALRRENIIEGSEGGIDDLGEQLANALRSPELEAGIRAATERLRQATDQLIAEREGTVPDPPMPAGPVGEA